MAEAVAPLEKANALKPDDVGTMVSLGLAYFESNQFEKAIPMLTKADALRPADETIQMFLRVARARLSVRDRLREYIDAAERNPGDKKALIRLADAYRYSGKPDMAEAQYRAAIKIDPRDFNLYNLQGIYFSDTGQKEKALDSYRTAAQLSNNHVIYLALSDAFERLGRLEEAVSAARRSVELKSTLLVSHLALGDLLNKQGKRDEAVQAYEAAYALNAGDPRPNFRLAWFYIKTGNKEGAIRHYDILRSLAPNDVGPLGRCIRAHFGR
jgi:tetratricopeptide (TPR) repeat protein